MIKEGNFEVQSLVLKCWSIDKRIETGKLKKCMHACREQKPPLRAYMDEPSKEVLKRMLRSNLTRLPVVNARNQLKGVIALKDLSEI